MAKSELSVAVYGLTPSGLFRFIIRELWYQFDSLVFIVAFVVVGVVLFHYTSFGDLAVPTIISIQGAIIFVYGFVAMQPIQLTIAKKDRLITLISNIQNAMPYATIDKSISWGGICLKTDYDGTSANQGTVAGALITFCNIFTSYDIYPLSVAANVLGMAWVAVSFMLSPFVGGICFIITLGISIYRAKTDHDVETQMFRGLRNIYNITLHSNERAVIGNLKSDDSETWFYAMNGIAIQLRLCPQPTL